MKVEQAQKDKMFSFGSHYYFQGLIINFQTLIVNFQGLVIYFQSLKIVLFPIERSFT